MSRVLSYVPILLVLLGIFGATAEAYYALTEVRRMLENPQPGATYRQPGMQWVRIVNPDGVRTPEQQLYFRELCILRFRGTVQAIGSSFLKGTLAEYRNPDGRPAANVQCPDGTVFFTSEDDLADGDRRFAARHAQEEALANFASQAAAQPHWGARWSVDRWDWVEVLNPQGVLAFGYDVDFLETCAIDAGGHYRTIGQDDRFGTLVHYTTAPGMTFRGTGIPCPSGTLFFMESNRSYRGA